jgi:hypothetical protein
MERVQRHLCGNEEPGRPIDLLAIFPHGVGQGVVLPSASNESKNRERDEHMSVSQH